MIYTKILSDEISLKIGILICGKTFRNWSIELLTNEILNKKPKSSVIEKDGNLLRLFKVEKSKF